MRLTVTLILITLAGCQHQQPQHFKGPEGHDAYTMRCSGAGRSWAKCYEHAGKLCPNGYNILSHDSDSYPIVTWNTISNVKTDTLVVECTD